MRGSWFHSFLITNHLTLNSLNYFRLNELVNATATSRKVVNQNGCKLSIGTSCWRKPKRHTFFLAPYQTPFMFTEFTSRIMTFENTYTIQSIVSDLWHITRESIAAPWASDGSQRRSWVTALVSNDHHYLAQIMVRLHCKASDQMHSPYHAFPECTERRKNSGLVMYS